MLPDFVPIFLTDKVYADLKLAEIFTSEFMINEQVDPVEHPATPDQLTKAESVPAEAVKVIRSPAITFLVQLADPELHTKPEPEMVPDPVPVAEADRVYETAEDPSTLTASINMAPEPESPDLANQR